MKEKQGNDTGDQGSPLSRLTGEEYCYVTTVGRVTGRPHEIEIWFALKGNTLYLLSGGDESSDWVKNMHADPSAKVRIGSQVFAGKARFAFPAEEEKLARRMLATKYQNWREGRRLSEWARTALPVAIDLLLTPGSR